MEEGRTVTNMLPRLVKGYEAALRLVRLVDELELGRHTAIEAILKEFRVKPESQRELMFLGEKYP